MTTFSDVESKITNPESNENVVSKLPKSKKDALWILEDVNSLTAPVDRELVVVNQERNYCVRCFYLIGIVTHEYKTEYSL
jgi:hypothetical protein